MCWLAVQLGVEPNPTAAELELTLHDSCDFAGQSDRFPRLFFVRNYEIFHRTSHACTVPAQSFGRQFQLQENRLLLRAFLCEIEQVMGDLTSQNMIRAR